MSTFNTSSTHGAPNTAGPHASDMANKLDPRVDSDLDGSRNLGARRADNYGSTTAGPHSSNVANKLDPCVDSDLDGSHNLGARTTAAGGTYGSSTNTGPHSSNMANKIDPRVDSDRDHRGTAATAGAMGGLPATGTGAHKATITTGAGHTAAASASTGPAPHTAGPHKSDLMNKLDPRVDSNLDGSKTIGGNKTHTY
jgi:hypothetical protein